MMSTKRRRSNLLCGFLKSKSNTFIRGICASLGSNWGCVEDEENCWKVFNPECDLEFFVTPSGDGTYDARTNLGLEIEQCDYPRACNWVQQKLDTFNRIKDVIIVDELNCAIPKDELAIIKNVFKSACDAVIMPEGFRYRSFRENASENSVIGTLEYKGNWVIKSSLAADFEDNVWTFIPNYNSEGHGTNREARGYSTLDIQWQDVTYQMTANSNSSVPIEKQIMFQLVGYLQDSVDAVQHDPPPRLYPLFWTDGILEDQDLATINKRGALNLVRQGIVPGRKMVKARPDMWRELFDKGYITEEDVLQTNPDKLFWLVKHGKLPVERALAVDPSLENKLRKAGIPIDETVFETRTPDEIIAAVSEGRLTPQKAWSLDPSLLKRMVEEELITPDDAYRLDPKMLNWLLINHHVGRSWANQRKSEAQTKSELTKQGVDWDSLEASRSFRHRKYR